MAQTYKILAQASLVATTGAYVYTVPDGKGAVISKIVVYNDDAATATVEIHIVNAADGAAVAKNKNYQATVATKATFSERLNAGLSNLDQVYFESDISNVAVSVYGIEFDQENVYAP